MAIIEQEYGGAGTPINPEDLPISVAIPSVSIPIPGLPVFPKTELGGATTFGVRVSYTCPGFPICGKTGDACTCRQESPIISVDAYLPIPEIDLNLIPLPKKVGPFGGGSISVPPRAFQPFRCANYPGRDPAR